MAANAVTDKGLYSESMNTVFAVTERSGRRVLLGVRFPPLKHGIVNDACHHPSVVSFASPVSCVLRVPPISPSPPPPHTPRPLPPLSSSSPTPSPATHAHHVFCRTGRNRRPGETVLRCSGRIRLRGSRRLLVDDRVPVQSDTGRPEPPPVAVFDS